MDAPLTMICPVCDADPERQPGCGTCGGHGEIPCVLSVRPTETGGVEIAHTLPGTVLGSIQGDPSGRIRLPLAPGTLDLLVIASRMHHLEQVATDTLCDLHLAHAAAQTLKILRGGDGLEPFDGIGEPAVGENRELLVEGRIGEQCVQI